MFKKIIISATMGAVALATITAHATPNMYVLGQIGAVSANVLKNPTDVNATSTNYSYHSGGGLGGRLALGTQLDQNWGVELGYLGFNQKDNLTLIDSSNPGAAYELKQKVIDLVGVGTLPLGDSHFSAFGKAGAAYVMRRTSGNLVGTDDSNAAGVISNPTSNFPTKENRFAPEFGLGVNYAFTPVFSTGVSYTFIHAPFKQHDNLPLSPEVGNGNISFAAVDFKYNFG